MLNHLIGNNRPEFCNGLLDSYFFKLTLGSDLLWKQVPEVFCEKGVVENFAKFLGKHLCWSLFLNKFSGWRFFKQNHLDQCWKFLIFSSSFMILKAIFSLTWYSPLPCLFRFLQNVLYLLILNCLEKFGQF